MFTNPRLIDLDDLALQRKCKVRGLTVGVLAALALSYFAPWMPQPNTQLSSWLISVAVVGILGSIAGCYLADFLADEEELNPPPGISESAD